jgi:hypothetical protein
MTRPTKVLLTLLIGLALVLAFSTYSQTTLVSGYDCRDCHDTLSPPYSFTTHHYILSCGHEDCHPTSGPFPGQYDCVECHVSDDVK